MAAGAGNAAGKGSKGNNRDYPSTTLQLPSATFETPHKYYSMGGKDVVSTQDSRNHLKMWYFHAQYVVTCDKYLINYQLICRKVGGMPWSQGNR